MDGFQPTDLNKSAIGSAEVTLPHREPPASHSETRKGFPDASIGSSGGASGKITFKDCDGQETGTLEWVNGKIITSGDQTIQGGCDDSSSIIG